MFEKFGAVEKEIEELNDEHSRKRIKYGKAKDKTSGSASIRKNEE